MRSQTDREKRQHDAIASGQLLKALLLEVISKPAEHLNDTNLAEGLRSQGALAKYEREGVALLPMSLNHQKKVFEDHLGGFDALDSLRRSAIDALQREKAKVARAGTNSKESLLAKVRDLEVERSTLLEDLFILQRAYDIRCVQARSYAQCADSSTQARCSKEQRELDVSFSLRRKSVDSNKVRPIDTSRRAKHA